jgi:AcrR family transcriptional regulator
LARVKSEARRSAIVAAAWDEFRQGGYERTTMSAINARAGGSRATIYGYFASKEELFAAALEFGLKRASEESFRELESPGKLPERLLRFARAHLASRLADDMTAIDRMLVVEGVCSDLFELVREKSFLKRRTIASLLEPEMAAGTLRDADPIRAAIDLLALIEADLVDRHLLGDRSITPGMIEEQIHFGVDTFLRAYSLDWESSR